MLMSKVPGSKDHASKHIACLKVAADKNYTRISFLSVSPAVKGITLLAV